MNGPFLVSLMLLPIVCFSSFQQLPELSSLLYRKAYPKDTFSHHILFVTVLFICNVTEGYTDTHRSIPNTYTQPKTLKDDKGREN